LFGDGNATIITEVIILKWEIMKSRENLSNWNQNKLAFSENKKIDHDNNQI
jgi:hypothetical protein